MTIDIQTFFKLRTDLPVVDVRSQNEYLSGHIPDVHNIPILNNEERVAVGTDYKQKGQLEAIKTGFRLVGPRLSAIVEAADQYAAGRELLVHCWRGGMRSNNFCQFIGMARVKSHSLQGGYKAYRQEALKSFELPLQFRVISGNTGSGKTELLRALARNGQQIIDLEAIASHKGSVFGGLGQMPQPTTEQFQNDLFECIMKLDLSKPVWIEDESIAIGEIFLPQPFWKAMQASAVVELEVSKENRIKRLVAEYGDADHDAFLDAMQRITKKLGGQHFNAARERLLVRDMPAVMDILLTYYDKAYQNSLIRRQPLIKGHIAWNDENIDDVARAMKSLI